MTLSLLGLGAVLASSAALFSILKWIGAAYLVYLGISLWRSNPGKDGIGPATPRITEPPLLRRAFIVTALNPKSIAFFVAFMPQFIDAQGERLPQFLVLGTTFLLLAALNAALYALFAGRLRDTIQDTGVRRWVNRCGGSALIGAGMLTAALHPSS